MDWGKIDIRSIMKLMRQFEKDSLAIDGKYAVIYSDEKEELKISYRNKRDDCSPNIKLVSK